MVILCWFTFKGLISWLLGFLGMYIFIGLSYFKTLFVKTLFVCSFIENWVFGFCASKRTFISPSKSGGILFKKAATQGALLL
jgi:hypothetical protein